MAYFDFKKIEFTIKNNGGGTMRSSYCGSLGFKRPESEYEAKKIAEEWILKRYPNSTIIDLKVELQ